MSFRVIVSIVFISLGLIFAILPNKNNKSNQPDVKELLLSVCDKSFIINSDELAKVLISKDPSYQLVDLRTEKEYSDFHLSNAINIPFDSLLNDNFIYQLDNPALKYVFYSNGTIVSAQAIILIRQLGFKNNLVLKGGLNEWFETIINPVKPNITSSGTEYNLYLSRIAAKEFFTGSKKNNNIESPIQAEYNKNASKKKKQSVQGGCS